MKAVAVAMAGMLVPGLLWAANMGLTLKLGTPGLGADVTLSLAEKVNLRAGLNYFSMEEDFTGEAEDLSDDITIEVDLATVPLLIDLHPLGNHFRLTAGVMLNNNEIKMTADPGSSVELDETDYTVSELEGSVTFDELSPYLGIGFGNAASEEGNWHFAFDLGVMLHGTPELALDATASNPALQDELDRAVEVEVADAQDAVDGVTMYPVIQCGLSYRF